MTKEYIRNTTFCVYELINPITGEIFYIGQTKNREGRYDAHSAGKYGLTKEICLEIKRKGYLLKMNLIFDNILSKREALQKEYEITFSYLQQGVNLVNKRIGAKASQKMKIDSSIKMKGRKWDRPFTEEHCRNLSLSLRGKKRKPHSLESRIKKSIRQTGKKLAPRRPEHSLAISLGKKGKGYPHSEQAKENMRKAYKKRLSRTSMTPDILTP